MRASVELRLEMHYTLSISNYIHIYRQPYDPVSQQEFHPPRGLHEKLALRILTVTAIKRER